MNVRSLARVVDAPPVQPGFAGPFHTAVEVLSPRALAHSDPFVLLMDDRIDAGEGIQVGGAHPHAGLETVTLVLSGTIRDRDEGELGPGDAVWMTAGRGVIHSENVFSKGDTRVLQLWIGLPARLRDVPAAFEVIHHATMPIRREPGAVLRVYSGQSGEQRSPTHNHVPVTLVDIELQADARVQQQLPAGHNGFVYVLEGTATIGGKPIAAGQIGWLEREAGDEETTLELVADEHGARAVLYAGASHGEAMLQHGPFVAGSEREIVRMHDEYRRGRFTPMSTLHARGLVLVAPSGALPGALGLVRCPPWRSHVGLELQARG